MHLWVATVAQRTSGEKSNRKSKRSRVRCPARSWQSRKQKKCAFVKPVSPVSLHANLLTTIQMNAALVRCFSALFAMGLNQCCQMVYFQTKNLNEGKFWKVLQWKVLVFKGHFVYFMANSTYILRPFGTFCGHLVNFFPVLVHCTKKIWQPMF
jgi:hypothetical protein